MVITGGQPTRFTNNEENKNAPTGAQTGETVIDDKDEVQANAEFVESAESVTLNSQLGSFRDFPIAPSREYEQFFKRPFETYQFTLDGNDNSSTRYAVEWPSDNLPSVYSKKLVGVYAFRADITARFIVSSTNMQSGIYRFCAFPMYGDIDHRNWTCTVQGTSYLPHIDVDLSCTRSADLKLPWVFPIAAAKTALTPLWRLIVLPIIPLATGTADPTASCSIWIIHDKFETYGSSAKADFQAGVMDKEEKKSGMVSFYLDKFTRSFNALQPVPIIGRYMSYLSTTSTALAKAARVWGFSAPVIQADAHKVITYNNRSMATGDEPVVAHVMGASIANSTPMTKFTGNSYDEMSFSYVLSKWWYYKQDDWTDGYEPGTLISNIDLAPRDFRYQYQGVGVPAQTFHHSALSYLADGFEFYKGSIKLKLSFAATQFHSGRVLVVYIPGGGAPTNTAMSAYRKILDISQHHSFEIEFPFLEPQAVPPWQRYGSVRLYVEETLRRPDTVASNVPVMIEVAAADDFRFFGWKGTDNDSYLWPPQPLRNVPYVPQAGCFVDTEPFDVSTPDMDDVFKHSGESIKSFRLLCKSDTRDVFLGLRTSETEDDQKLSYSAVRVRAVDSNPTTIPLRPSAVPREEVVNDLTVSSLSSRVALGYYGFKGSKRHRFRINSNVMMSVGFTNTDALRSTLAPTEGYRGRLQLIGNADNSNTSVVQAPYNAITQFFVPATTPTVSFGSLAFPTLIVNTNSTEDTKLMSFSSVGEDFDCQFFIGWPVCTRFRLPADWTQYAPL